MSEARIGVASCKDAIALQVDDLFGLCNCEGKGIIPALIGVRSNKLVLFHTLRAVLFDDPGGLVLTIAQVRSRPNAVALVLDGRYNWFLRFVGSSPADKPRPCRFKFR